MTRYGTGLIGMPENSPNNCGGCMFYEADGSGEDKSLCSNDRVDCLDGKHGAIFIEDTPENYELFLVARTKRKLGVKEDE